MKRKSVALIAILSMAICITACGSKADEASKELNESNESQVVVESSTEEKTETPTITESEAVVETTGAVETEEVAVTEPKLKVEIIENLESEALISITNISDEEYYAGFSSCGVWGADDFTFKPDETLYGIVASESVDRIANELEQFGLMERVNDGDTVSHLDTFTSDQFADVVELIESFKNSYAHAYHVMYYNDDTFLGATNEIWTSPEDPSSLRLDCDGANKIVILWVEETF